MLPAIALAVSLQAPARPDTTARDTVRLEPVEVTVTRGSRGLHRVPASVGVLDSTALRRARVLAGLDESLGQIPGIVVANRYNPSLDQRLVIRGAGARANFGVRGIKILIDGLPQTLPDGQSQLTNLDLGLVSRVEALLGSASALYGNAAGGVLSFTTGMPSDREFARLRAGGGAFGTSRVSLAAGGARGSLRGLVGAARYESSGYRQHSATRSTQITLAGDAIISPTWLVRGRYFLADAPRAENPGALTAAELVARPDSAAAANILRGADKSVSQHQLGVTLTGITERDRLDIALFGLTRNLDNPLAVAPPGPPSPTAGTFSAIDRLVGGGRVHAVRRLTRWNARVGIGVEAQTMRDDRINRRSDAGEPSDPLLVDQRERATEIGPFVTMEASPTAWLAVTGALRYDWLRFGTRDRLLADGEDASGRRTMSAASGSLGVSVAGNEATAWLALSSAFETPTTTELANRPDGLDGFNDRLDPQRATSVEVGLRSSGRVSVSAVAYHTDVRQAIVQAREVNGRAYFENAGRLRHRGLELGIGADPLPWLRGQLSWTWQDSRFTEYRVRDGASIDTLDGNRVPAVPRHTVRAVLAVDRATWSAELEQQIVSSQAADDRNAVIIDGWGAGITTARVAARRSVRAGAAMLDVSPFLAIHNLFDRRYVGSANVNGFGGRVFEPAPGRWAFLGVEIGWRGGE